MLVLLLRNNAFPSSSPLLDTRSRSPSHRIVMMVGFVFWWVVFRPGGLLLLHSTVVFAAVVSSRENQNEKEVLSMSSSKRDR